VASTSAVSESIAAVVHAKKVAGATIATDLAAERDQWAQERAEGETTLQAMRDPARWQEAARSDGARDILFDGQRRLWIAPSPIEGMGGFAARPYEAGELILILAGETCDRDRRLTSRHVFLSGGTFVDAAEHWSGALNGSGPGATANAEWRESGGIYALHGIPEGSEIIISYGPAYWAMHGSKAKTGPPPAVSAGQHAAVGLTAIQLAASPPVEVDTTSSGGAAPALAGRVSAEQIPDHELPLRGLPARFENEYTLANLPTGFVWPEWTHVAFHEHSGELREAWANAGVPACSVADRRTMLRPSAGCAHFIGSVQEFIDAFPHPIQFQSSHVPCGASNWASWKT